LKFLTSISDDPEDCVTSDVRAAISSVEKDLIQLRIGDHTYSPDKVLHCNEIDDRTQTCKGAELDDTPLDDETALLAPKRALPKTGTATISVAEGADFKVLALFAQGRAALQDGKPPVQIPMRDGAFSLNELQRYPHPALILTLHGNDTLRFRKCVWLF
jgi:hypothetical protein